MGKFNRKTNQVIFVIIGCIVFVPYMNCSQNFQTKEFLEFSSTLDSSLAVEELKINSPPSQFATKDVVRLQGVCSPGVRVDISGDVLVPTSTDCQNREFLIDVVLSEIDGAKNVVIQQLDYMGNIKKDSRSFVLDTTPPTVNVIAPAANAVRSTSLAVTGQCETGLAVQLQIGNLSQTANCVASTFTANMNLTPLDDGNLALQVSQKDSVDLTTTKQVTFRKDTIAPNIAILSPASGASVVSPVTLSGSCETGVNVIISGSGVSSGLTVLCSNASFSAPISLNSGSGSRLVTVSQTDEAGNTGTQSRTFQSTVPTVPPLATAISAPAANTVAKTGVTLQGTCQSGVPVVLSGTGLSAGSNVNCTSGNFSAAITFSNGDGAKFVNVKQTDSTGNTGQDSRSFFRDSTPPTLTISMPAANTAAKTGVTVTGACETGLSVQASGGGVSSTTNGNCSGGSYSMNLTFSNGDGTKAVTLTQTDAAGNAASVTRNFIRDTTPPNLTIFSPAAGTSAATDLVITGTCETGLNVVASGTGVQSSSSKLCANSSYSMTVVFSSGDGSKVVQFSQTDAAGNVANVSRTFNRTTPPVAYDGVALYGTNCAACHNPLASSTKKGRNYQNIFDAIQVVPSMISLKSLNEGQLNAIASALGTATTPQVAEVCVPSELSAALIRRLNAREMVNSVRDVLGVNMDISKLPSDNRNGLGFDNDSEVLRIYDIDTEKYLDFFDEVVNALYASAPKTGFDYTCATNLTGANRNTCVRGKLTLLTQRAWKKAAAASDLDLLVQLSNTESNVTDGLKKAMTAALMSPNFLYFHVVGNISAGVKTLNSHEVAHRLALFLWSSVPDDALMTAANQNQLITQAQITAQVERMMASDKFMTGFVAGFVDQWLQLGQLRGATRVDPSFPTFSAAHLDDMAQETRQFVLHILRNNRPMEELFTANYSFVNSRLAQMYGISGQFSANQYVQTPMNPAQRQGLLTHGSILTITSNTTITSPVKRGHWVTKKVLCQEPPPPPPDAPTLPPGSETELSIKERLAVHRSDARCASCHVNMDPIGIGLENFSSIGRWRTNDGRFPVDATETLNNVPFNGPVEMATLVSQTDSVPACVTKQVATYSVARSLSSQDSCYVTNLALEVKDTKKSMKSVLIELMNSPLFLKHRSGE